MTTPKKYGFVIVDDIGRFVKSCTDRVSIPWDFTNDIEKAHVFINLIYALSQMKLVYACDPNVRLKVENVNVFLN